MKTKQNDKKNPHKLSLRIVHSVYTWIHINDPKIDTFTCIIADSKKIIELIYLKLFGKITYTTLETIIDHMSFKKTHSLANNSDISIT